MIPKNFIWFGNRFLLKSHFQPNQQLSLNELVRQVSPFCLKYLYTKLKTNLNVDRLEEDSLLKMLASAYINLQQLSVQQSKYKKESLQFKADFKFIVNMMESNIVQKIKFNKLADLVKRNVLLLSIIPHIFIHQKVSLQFYQRLSILINDSNLFHNLNQQSACLALSLNAKVKNVPINISQWWQLALQIEFCSPKLATDCIEKALNCIIKQQLNEYHPTPLFIILEKLTYKSYLYDQKQIPRIYELINAAKLRKTALMKSIFKQRQQNLHPPFNTNTQDKIYTMLLNLGYQVQKGVFFNNCQVDFVIGKNVALQYDGFRHFYFGTNFLNLQSQAKQKFLQKEHGLLVKRINCRRWHEQIEQTRQLSFLINLIECDLKLLDL